MARDWEADFSKWTGRASNAEQTRYETTRDAIDEALRKSTALSGYSFDVYPKGSYPAFTNVVADSDVDVAAEMTTFFTNRFVNEARGLTLADVNVDPYVGDRTLEGFKDDVQRALISGFSSGAVTRGKKAIHIEETRRSLKADVVPCVTNVTWVSRTTSRKGIRLRNDANPSELILNYPKQHLAEGTKKNDATSRRYKRVVRILKRLENEMVDRGVIGVVPSFLIESAVYNAPDGHFMDWNRWTDRVEAVLTYIYNGTNTDDCVNSEDWLEVNRCKYLFFDGQGWTRQDANDFALEAWRYIGFENK